MARFKHASEAVKQLINAENDLVAADLSKLADVDATAAEIDALSGVGAAVASGTQVANIASIAITYSSNDPSITANGAVTVADGSSASAAELLELCEEIIANQNAIIAALEAFGIAASS